MSFPILPMAFPIDFTVDSNGDICSMIGYGINIAYIQYIYIYTYS